VFPGYVALKISPDLLTTLLADRALCVVSGTNGKTTTTALVAAMLGDTVTTNKDGANLPAGWVSALLDEGSDRAGRGGPVVLEVDESYLPAALQAAPTAVVALLNLSRDQLDRHSETRMLAQRWRDTLIAHPGARVVANVDDPLVTWAATAHANVTWVAGGAEWHSDAAACPACGTLLARSPTTWSCPACGLARPDPTIEYRDGYLLVAGTKFPVSLALPGRANRGNLAVAVGAAQALGVPTGAALEAAGQVRTVSGRYGRYRVAGHEVILLLAKNPAGWVETLDVIDDVLTDGHGTVVVAVSARGPDGCDPSWLWDVPFEQLAGRAVIATGERATDLAVRLDHAGVAYRKDTREPLVAALSAREDPVVIAATYTNFLTLSRRLDHGS
ncbi:MAG TPA: MurT ligase domain-containing protein, partial [Acidimicrobiia bacterium]|nr:MurT ligase domain-containing protein [Acidimicrobiia bacterium]